MLLFIDGTLLKDLEDEEIELTEEEKSFASQATPSHILMFATGATKCTHCWLRT